LAKRELIEGLAGPEPVAVLNADDERVRRFADVARGSVLTFGFGADAQFRAEKIEDRGAEGSAFDFVGPDAQGDRAAVAAGGEKRRTRLTLPLPGRHNIGNALGALAAASAWGIGAADAAQIFPQLVAGEMRGQLLRFAEGFAVINDSYNSNPVALAAMINLMERTPGYGRRILAAGQMLELGPDSARLHRDAGREAASRHLDWLVAVGGDAEQLAQGAIKAGLPAERVRFFADSAEAGAFVAGIVTAGDLVLVKGSRGVRMERVVEALRAAHALADGPEATPPIAQGRR
jgi:UDP-N-acetylmuramoyl-tripeptide--D-alanyl-D-alanine ligase